MHIIEPALGYTDTQNFHIGVTMTRGKAATYEPNIFNTWLDYQLSAGVTQAELIRRVNEVLKKKYHNVTFYQWKTKQRTLPDIVYTTFIVPDLAKLYEWHFKLKGVKPGNIDFQSLAQAFSPCVKAAADTAETSKEIH